MSAKIYCDDDESEKQMYESEIQATTIINYHDDQQENRSINLFIIKLSFHHQTRFSEKEKKINKNHEMITNSSLRIVCVCVFDVKKWCIHVQQ